MESPHSYPYPRDARLKIDWINTLFLTLTPLIAIAGATLLFWHSTVHWATFVLAAFFMLASGLGITAGYHRLFAHKSYEASWIVRFVILMFGASAFQNSARKWCSDHRYHHQHVDKFGDPYNINKGFWHAHIGWIFRESDPKPLFENVPDLMADPLIRFQDKHYLLLSALTGLALPMAVASLWGDPWGGLVFAGFVRLVLNHHFTFFINSLCHFVGDQPYSDKNTARDNWFMAILTYGEGYHNFHHAFQSDFRNGVRAYHWDPTKWFILLMERLGQAKKLRRTPDARILQARLRMDEIRLVQTVKEGFAKHLSTEFIAASRQRLEEAHLRFENLKDEYRRLKKQKMDSMNETFHKLNDRLHGLKDELQKAKASFDEAMRSWGQLTADLS